jgi:hypothetical protein
VRANRQLAANDLEVALGREISALRGELASELEKRLEESGAAVR